MITWKPYELYEAQYAEVGAFILEAHPNGSWVVRHVTGAVPCITSELEPIINPSADLASAKAKAISALSEMQANEQAIRRYEAITVKFCERYQEYRRMMKLGMEEPSHENDALFTEMENSLDGDVERFLLGKKPVHTHAA